MTDFDPIERQQYLGGSDIAAALGLSPWQTPVALYLEKIGEPQREVATLERVFWGNELEDRIAAIGQSEYGLKLRRDNREYVHPEKPYLRAHIDRRVVGVNEIAEIKNIGFRMLDHWGPDGTDGVPLYYLTQAFHYLGLTGAECCHFLVLAGGQELRHYVVETDLEAIEAIWARADAFWQRVQERRPPEPTTQDDVAQLYRKVSKGIVQQAGDAEIALHRELMIVHNEIARLEEKRNAFEIALKHFMKDADTLLIGDFPAITWKEARRTDYDMKAFAEENPVLAESYRRVSKYRRFLAKPLKGQI